MYFIRNNLNKIIIIFLLIVLGFVIGIKYYLNMNKNIDNREKEIKIEKKIEKKEVNNKEVKKIYVDVKGAVKKPGVYEIDADKKVIDVVYLAGGLSDEADTTLINLAKKLTDEMVVIIYTKAQIKEARKQDLMSIEVQDSCVCPKIENDACINNKSNSNKVSNSKSNNDSNKSMKDSNNVKSDEKVNINTASLEELQSLSGIGEGKARAIISYREENGNFTSIEDLLKVSGIGESIYEKIKDSITV